MRLKTLLSAAALAATATFASADDFTITVPLVANSSITGAYSAGWGVTHVEAGDFTDTFTFSPDVTGFFSGSLVTIGFMDNQDIDFTSVTVNGQNFALTSSGAVETATFDMTGLTGPITMVVNGTAGGSLADGTAISASYAGTANVSPIPELETHALMLAGLGVIGLMSRRRLQQR